MTDECFNRALEWTLFSDLVLKHIKTYTVPQYGDMPYDQASQFTERDIALQIRKYANRLETGARGPEEARRDLLKIAHYCAMLHARRLEKK